MAILKNLSAVDCPRVRTPQLISVFLSLGEGASVPHSPGCCLLVVFSFLFAGAPEGERDTTIYKFGLSGRFIQQQFIKSGFLAVGLGLLHARCLSPKRPRLLETPSYIEEEGRDGK